MSERNFTSLRILAGIGYLTSAAIVAWLVARNPGSVRWLMVGGAAAGFCSAMVWMEKRWQATGDDIEAKKRHLRFTALLLGVLLVITLALWADIEHLIAIGSTG